MADRIVRVACAVGAIFLGMGSGAARAEQELFVANNQGNSITVYSRTASGNVAPSRTLAGAATGLNQPYSLVVDTVNNELVVANATNDISSITVYALNASGNTAPLRTIAGPTTGLNQPHALVVDNANSEIVAVNFAASSVTVYARTASGDAAPLRTIAGAATGLYFPAGLALDAVNGELVVANSVFMRVTVYPRSANGNVAPLRTLAGPTTGLSGPIGLAVDTVHNELVAVSNGTPAVRVYNRTASGDVAPLRSIVGASTGLSQPFGLAVDLANDELFVANIVGSSVTVYARTANGDTRPLRTLSGAATGLNFPVAVATAPGAASGSSYFTVSACRMVDTRNPDGPYGGPALAGNADRTFVIPTQCGIPLGASAVAFNFTITEPTAQGHLRALPVGIGLPLFSTMNWRPGQTRANNAIVSLGPSGDITVHVDQASRTTVGFIIDVNGYFQ